MKTKIRDMQLMVGRVSPRHRRVLVILLTLAMLVLAGGAPGGGSGWGG